MLNHRFIIFYELTRVQYYLKFYIFIGYDRIFLNKYCPKFSSHLHYRTIDVSTIKELVRLWNPKDESFKKELSHRAIDDIRESIAELKYYREHYFKGKNTPL